MKKRMAYFVIIILLAVACHDNSKKENGNLPNLPFDPSVFTVKSTKPFEKARGQIVYVPVYSNIPFVAQTKDLYDLSGILTIHNTDMYQKLTVSQVLYFHNDGHLVKNYLEGKKIELNPLESKSFVVPQEDQSGTGANFLVEWKTAQLVCIPLIECVMARLSSGQSVSFLSTGKVIEQMD
jgi:hypothetical protein